MRSPSSWSPLLRACPFSCCPPSCSAWRRGSTSPTYSRSSTPTPHREPRGVHGHERYVPPRRPDDRPTIYGLCCRNSRPDRSLPHCRQPRPLRLLTRPRPRAIERLSRSALSFQLSASCLLTDAGLGRIDPSKTRCMWPKIVLQCKLTS